MSASLALLVTLAALYAAGVYLLLDRSLTRVLLGVMLLGNATNLLILLAGGPAGEAPISDRAAAEEMSDPLVHAMILTAIVITVGIAAFVLALIHRSWLLDQAEDVVDDAEDVRLLTTEDDDTEGQLGPGEAEYDTGDDTDDPVRRPSAAPARPDRSAHDAIARHAGDRS